MSQNIIELAKKLKAAREKATLGEWKTQATEYVGFLGQNFFQVIGGIPDEDGDLVSICSSRIELENADFIALAANHVTEICDAAIKLAEDRARLRVALLFYSGARFNRQKQEWMSSEPDKAINALALSDELEKQFGGNMADKVWTTDEEDALRGDKTLHHVKLKGEEVKAITLKPNGYDDGTWEEAKQEFMQGWVDKNGIEQEDEMAFRSGANAALAWICEQLGIDEREIAQGKR